MRLDTQTEELPGIEPAPVPVRVVRLSQAQRRAAAGYVGPRDVESCRTCCNHITQCSEMPRGGLGYVANRCGLHGWPVQLGAVCDDWSELPF